MKTKIVLGLCGLLALVACADPISLRGSVQTEVTNYTASTAPLVAPVTFSPASGTFSSDQTATLICATPNAIIHYTTDGSDPTASSPTYTAPIAVTGKTPTTTLKALAMLSGMRASVIAQATYTINYKQVAPPTFSPAPGSYSSDQLITLVSNTPGVSFRYTLDGSLPTSAGAGIPYVSPFLLPANTSTVIKVVAYGNGLNDSTVVSGSFISSPAGSVDLSFGGVGTGSNVTGLHGTQLKGLGVLSTGEVVFSGIAVSQSTQDLWISKTSSAGILASSGGVLAATTNLSLYVTGTYQPVGGTASVPGCLLVEPNDTVVVGGWVPTGPVVVLVDSGMNPLKNVPLVGWGVAAKQVNGLALLGDGSLVVVGTDGANLFVSHILPGFTLDSAYGTSGTLTVSGVTPAAVFPLASGGVKVVGLMPGFNMGSVVTVQITSSGTLDRSYGAGTGEVANVLPQYGQLIKNGYATVSAAAVQTDGRIVFAGNPVGVAASDHPWLIGRINIDGSLDSSFGNPALGGMLLEQVPQAYAPPNYVSQNDVIGGVSITSGGQILVVGSSQFLDSAQAILGVQNDIARFTPAGRLDLTFNTGTPYGGLILSHGNFLYSGTSLIYADGWGSVATQATGRTIVGGATSFYLKLARYW